jgi:hypothetical protein
MNGTIEKIISSKTLIPLGLVATCASPLLIGVLAWNNIRWETRLIRESQKRMEIQIEESQKRMEIQLKIYMDRLEDHVDADWVRDDMCHWRDILKARNNGLDVPPAVTYRGLVEMGNE